MDRADESHTISQDIDTATASYWHGIMHRREPDFSNSKYWFRRVGEHPIFSDLCAEVNAVARGADLDETTRYLESQTNWDAFAFVDSCEATSRGHGNEQLCRRIAELEWQILFDFCYQEAIKA